MNNNIIVDKRKINIRNSNFARVPSQSYNEIKMYKPELRKIFGKGISVNDIFKDHSLDFPKYVYPIINKKCDMSKACGSSNVSHLHTLIKQKKFRTINEWKKWYIRRYPDNVEKAIHKLYNVCIKSLFNISSGGIKISKKGKEQIRDFCTQFIENLMFKKTFVGLKVQEAILFKLSEIMNEKYVWASPEDDSSGIDGYIGKIPVSVKPKSCKYAKKAGVKRIIYTIEKDHISFVHSL